MRGLLSIYGKSWAFQVALVVKNLPAKTHGFYPRIGKIPCRRAWQPSPVFWPGKSHGQRSLVGYSPRGHKRVSHDLATNSQYSLSQLCLFGNYRYLLFLSIIPLYFQSTHLTFILNVLQLCFLLDMKRFLLNRSSLIIKAAVL